jgi:antagonist of KipI
MNYRAYLQFAVVQPGLFTTVQDQGRFGFQRFGVPVCGALDPFAAAVANILVGNSRGAALLEVTLLGPTLHVLEEAVVALTGAAIPLSLNGRPVPGWTACRVRRGDRLAIGAATSGCRAYLAVSGGLAVPAVMGSASCYGGAGIGGHRHGQPLATGDRLCRRPGIFPPTGRTVPPALRPDCPREIVLRAIPGPQDGSFAEGLDLFFSAPFTVSPEASRMGYRLEGPEIRQKPGLPASIISEPSFPGGVQIPPNGQPIILLVEQTVGGYSKIASVVSTDLSRLAQAVPGNRIRFARVGLDEAYRLAADREKLLTTLADDFAREEEKAASPGEARANDSCLARFAQIYPECLP